MRLVPDRAAHVERLRRSLSEALEAGEQRRRRIPGLEATDETMLAVRSAPGYQLAIPKLDGSGCRLISMTSASGAAQPETAIIQISDSGLEKLRSRLAAFAAPGQQSGGLSRPAEADLVANIDEISLGEIQDLWQGPGSLPEDERWWQLWLELALDREEHDDPLEVLRHMAPALGIEVSERSLSFPRRVVVHVHGNAYQLSQLVGTNALPTEVRPVPFVSEFAAAPLEMRDELLAALPGRTVQAQREGAPVVTVLDTGVHVRHPLLRDALVGHHSLRTDGLASDQHGHGTAMAGLALYGDLSSVLAHDLPVYLRHRIESVRILGLEDEARSAQEYGLVMAEAVARVEIDAPTAARVYSMSVSDQTDSPLPQAGKPSAWSTALDALAYGHEIQAAGPHDLKFLSPSEPGSARLFVVSAGNVRDGYVHNYRDRCDLMPVEDPAQSWNAVTVGAFTRLSHVPAQSSSRHGWRPLAPEGDLSPFSRTGVPLDKRWPNKPDIVMEGGNLLVQDLPGGGLDHDPAPTHGVLTTSRDATKVVEASHATSPATAQAARLAAVLMEQYPQLGVEAVRGMLVHSAEWTPAMLAHFTAAGAFKTKGNKPELGALVRRYGWGTPTRERLLRSVGNQLTLIAQEQFKPLRVVRGRDVSLSEMQVHELPWPVAELRALGQRQVRMRVTLSYLVEPWVGRQGDRDRFVYPSHVLHFDLRRPGEDAVDFQRRVSNDAASTELGRSESVRRVKPREEKYWLLGPQQRQRGSLEADLWQGPASELADRSHLAVYPAGGWWLRQKRVDRAEVPVRYALLVSLQTDDAEIDLLTPISTIVDIRTPTLVPIQI